MDFFEHQDRSRRKSRWLVVMFLLAALAIIAAVDAVAIVAFGSAGTGGARGAVAANWDLVLGVSVITALVILAGSAFRIAQLRSGGGDVARSLGGVPVPAHPSDPRQRRLRNVVEETALAAGLPVPEIYVLEQETAINAFAAGNTPADAAIAVTRGTLERLSRDELQGVIAHEFSHVANGDMRLNLRLMGWLFGILLIALAGRGLLRAGAHGGGRRKSGAIALFGVALFVVGYIGVFAGRLIKAAVSRERERLADASAVQFTRNPTGLAGALKKIGGLGAGSRLSHAEAEEVSHMLFAEGLAGLFDTHPPLVERIRALEPGFDARELERISTAPAAVEPDEPAPPGLASTAVDASSLVAAAGAPGVDQIRAGQALHRRLPATLKRAAGDEEEARALVAALLLADDGAARSVQDRVVAGWLGEDGARRAAALAGESAALAHDLRLPLLEIVWPTLRHLPREALAEMSRAVRELVRADGRVSVFEYALARILRVQVRDLSGERTERTVRLKDCRVELADLFAVVARAGQSGEDAARRAYEAGLSRLLPRERPAYRQPAEWRAALDRGLDRLDRLPSVIKRELLRALGTTCSHDARLAPAETDLLRAVAASLHCPLPPVA